MKGSEFVFCYVQLLYFKCHRINCNHGGWYIDSSDWTKNKKSKINPIKNGNKGFQYAATVAWNHEEIGKHSERITKTKPFINKCNRARINFPWKICTAYVSRHNLNCEKQVIVLVTPNCKRRYYLAVKTYKYY